MPNMNDQLINVYQQAIKVAGNPGRHALASEAARELDILFYGMMCFDPLPDRSGYRVLFPNGLDLSDLSDIPVHAPGVWIRDRGAMATARWSGFAFRNDFFVGGKYELTITGLAETPLNTDEFEDRVVNLQDCAPNFTIGDDRDSVVEMTVDRGTLSAHVVGGGMIVVKWTVAVEGDDPVRFSFGDDFIDVPASATQVFLANVSATADGDTDTKRHFQLYRKLSADRSQVLEFKPPRRADLNRPGTLVLNDPTFGYMSHDDPKLPAEPPKEIAPPRVGGYLPVVGDIRSASAVRALVPDAVAFTPELYCSPVASQSLGTN